MSDNANSESFNNRPLRVTSHALVDVKRFKHLPIFAYSAVLLDISLGGYKLEFTGEVEAKPGSVYWLSIPLRPLGIYSPERLSLKTEIRWFDNQRYRIGGVFMTLTKSERLIIEQILDALKGRGMIE